ncbi:MAG: tetratricopeptide repeat protein [Scytonema sp. PMC 1069.18]|nr:tetratricopeptide repeat protein [Scytonema sp. PMC 1069.18]MEC4885668.1 tetratricopeptide repeat protein [Scytonema sp. PMC 1070.18]
MLQKCQLSQWLLKNFTIRFLHTNFNWRKTPFKLLYTVFFVLGAIASSIIPIPGSKLLAEDFVPSQNLEAASFFQQGVMRYHRKDLQAAENAFRQALQHDPNIAAAYNYLGNIMLQQNHLDVAVQEYGEAIRINPNLSEAYYNLGLALHKQGQQEAAITAYRQVLVINPTMATAYYNLGLALYELGQVDEAIAAYQQATHLDSRDANAYSNLAIALQQKGQTQEAIATYRKALELNPQNAQAYNNMASLMALRGQTSEAIAIYQEAIRKVPNHPTTYYNLGVAWYNQGDYKKAEIALKRAQDEYRQQGNIEQADKTVELMQQIAQLAAYKKTQVGQNPNPAPTPTPTSHVVIPEPEIPTQAENFDNTLNNLQGIPIPVEQIPPELLKEPPLQPVNPEETKTGNSKQE